MRPELLTPRLRGEPHRLDHLPLLLQLVTDSRVTASLTLNGQPMAYEAAETGMRQAAAHWDTHDFGRWMWFERQTGAFVGTGGLRIKVLEGEPVIDVGYVVRPECWGQGYATEITEASAEQAFRHLHFKSITAWTLPTNLASQRVMQKIGLRYVRDVQWAGAPHMFFELRREEWRS